MAKRLRIMLLACMLVIGMSSVPVGPSNASTADSGSSSSATSTLSKQSKKCKKLKKKAKKSKKAKKKYKKKCKKKSGSGGGGTGGGGGGGTGGGGGGGGTGGGSGTCPAYVPGEEGAGAETTIVTDAATEAAPIEVTVPTEPGAGPAASTSVFRNIQVNSTAATTGLWVRFEMEVGEDYDIYLNNADGTEAAHAGGYNPAPVVPGETDGTGAGGHSEQTAEQIDGVSTPDCGGYTLDMSSFQTPGGDKTLKLWLGVANCTPPCGGPAARQQ